MYIKREWGKNIDIKRMGKNKYKTGKMYIMGKYRCTLGKLYIIGKNTLIYIHNRKKYIKNIYIMWN